jgi:hypothetical protein
MKYCSSSSTNDVEVDGDSEDSVFGYRHINAAMDVQPIEVADSDQFVDVSDCPPGLVEVAAVLAAIPEEEESPGLHFGAPTYSAPMVPWGGFTSSSVFYVASDVAACLSPLLPAEKNRDLCRRRPITYCRRVMPYKLNKDYSTSVKRKKKQRVG